MLYLQVWLYQIQKIQNKTQLNEVASNIQNIQTAVDIFYIDNNSQYLHAKPTIQNPQLINFDLLPKYIKLTSPSFKYID